MTWKTGNQLGIFPRVIPIPKWNSLPIGQTILLTLTHKRPLKCWQELKKGFPFAPLGPLQENKRRRAPLVSHNLALRIALQQLKITFFNPSAVGEQDTIRPTFTKTLTGAQNGRNPSLHQGPSSLGNKKTWTVWKFIPNELAISQSPHGTRQNKLIFLSHEWWCAADVQKPQQPTQRKAWQSSDCVPSKKPEALVNGCGKKKQISTTSFHSSEPDANWFRGWTPENSKRRLRSCCPSDHRTSHIFQETSTPEGICKPSSFGKWCLSKNVSHLEK